MGSRGQQSRCMSQALCGHHRASCLPTRTDLHLPTSFVPVCSSIGITSALVCFPLQHQELPETRNYILHICVCTVYNVLLAQRALRNTGFLTWSWNKFRVALLLYSASWHKPWDCLPCSPQSKRLTKRPVLGMSFQTLVRKLLELERSACLGGGAR